MRTGLLMTERQREQRILDSIVRQLDEGEAMTVDKLKSLFQFYLDHMLNSGYRPMENKVDDSTKTYQLAHCAWMCDECLKEKGLIEQGRVEKAMRWLGYIQDVLCAFCVFKLEELKTHSRSDK